MKVPRIPDHIDETIRTHERLRGYLEGFVRGTYGLLIIQGRPGISKSELLKKVMKDTHGVILSGQLTPLEVYKLLYRNRGRPIGLDDAEALYDDEPGQRLVRQITETTSVKWPTWVSSTSKLGDVPQKFPTNSTFCIITNGWIGGQAITSRGLSIFFDPTNEEVHKDAGTWFWDREVYKYAGERLHLFDGLESRHYVKASWLKDHKDDWKAYLDQQCHKVMAQVVQQLEVDEGCKTSKDRVEQFTKLTGHSRATYFRLKRELLNGDNLSPTIVPSKLNLQLPKTNQKPERMTIEDLKKLEEEMAGENGVEEQPNEEQGEEDDA